MCPSATQPRHHDNNSRLQFDNNNLDTQGTGSLLKLRKGLRVGTFNTRTCHSAAEADEIALDLKAAGVMVCGMQELRRRGEGHDKGLPRSGYHLIWSGGALDRRKERGVGVLLHPEVAKALTGYYGVEKAEDRLMVLHFAGAIQASIVVAYAPTEVSDAPSKDAFYSALDATLDALPRHRMIMILGDMNARVGRAKDSWPGIIGAMAPPRAPPPLPSPLCRAAAGSGGGGGRRGFGAWHQKP